MIWFVSNVLILCFFSTLFKSGTSTLIFSIIVDRQFFVELLAEVINDPYLKSKATDIIPGSLTSSDEITIFDVPCLRFERLATRSEDLIVKHVSLEVEHELKQHLTRFVLFPFRLCLWDFVNFLRSFLCWCVCTDGGIAILPTRRTTTPLPSLQPSSHRSGHYSSISAISLNIFLQPFFLRSIVV